MRLIPLLVLFALCACGQSDWHGFIEGEEGRVVRVIDGDLLALNTGQVVRLVAIEAPSFGRDGAPDHPEAQFSKDATIALALGRRAKLYYAGLTRDRYERALAHMQVIDEAGHSFWLNKKLIEQGAAWVRVYPDNEAHADLLLEAERVARRQALGIWGNEDLRFRNISDLQGDTNRFAFVTISSERLFPLEMRSETLCSRDVDGVTVQFVGAAASHCRAVHFSSERVELRGWFSNNKLTVTHGDHVQPQIDPSSSL